MKLGAVGLAFFVLLAAFGCGVQDGTTEARLEAARIAMDAQDWDGAIAILTDLCGTDPTNPTCDVQTRGLFASAHLGRGGLDLINLIRKAGGAGGDAFKAMSTSCGDADPNDFRFAQTLLKTIPPPPPVEESAVQDSTGVANIVRNLRSLQLGIAATCDLVSRLGKISGGFDLSGRPNKVPTVDEAKTILTDLQGDLQTIKEVVLQLVPDNRIRDTVNQVSKDLDADGNGTLTEAEIQAYITKVKGS